MFLAGIVSAWSMVQVGLGIYFMLAYLVGRREREFFLFSLLCFSFSVGSIGIAYDYVATTPQAHHTSDLIVYSGMILAPAFNAHFAMEFAEYPPRRRIAVAMYAAAVVF